MNTTDQTNNLEATDTCKKRKNPLIFSDKAIDNILKATGLPSAGETPERLKENFMRHEVLDNFLLIESAFIADKSPSETRKKIESMTSNIGKVIKYTSKIQGFLDSNKTDLDELADFRYVYEQGRKNISHAPSLKEFLNISEKMVAVLEFVKTKNEQRIGKSPSHIGKDEHNYLIMVLSEIFLDVYKRKPTVDSKNRDDAHESYFLRFSSQTMKEMQALGFEIKNMSMTYDALRDRYNKIISSKQK